MIGKTSTKANGPNLIAIDPVSLSKLICWKSKNAAIVVLKYEISYASINMLKNTLLINSELFSLSYYLYRQPIFETSQSKRRNMKRVISMNI